MTDLSLADFFLSQMTTYGSLALALALLLGAVGVPLPTTLLVVTAGASVQEGLFNGSAALGLGLLGAISGDNISYVLGRFATGRVRRCLGHSGAWRRAQDKFERHGALTVYLTRFLFAPLAIPTNLIAGGSNYTFRRFLVYDAAGELTWLLMYGGLGYALSSINS